MLYVFAGILIAVALVFGIIARKKIDECKTEEEKRAVKAKWQLICGFLGAACIIILVVIIYIGF